MTELSAVKGMFEINSQLFEKISSAVPAELWLSRPGDDSNHMTWVAGHAVVHLAMVTKMLGTPWTTPWEGLFKRGEKVQESAQYPTPLELQQAWKEVTERLRKALEDASAETLSRPIQAPSPSLDGTVGGLVAFLCLHETYHVGQMGFLRKMLGCGQTVG
jgi:uncharacterized damage-inducible protein DinB